MRVLSERWVLSLALPDPEHPAPHPCALFYVAIEPNTIGEHASPLLGFVSDPASHHGQLTGRGPIPAAAAVYLESAVVGELRGAQLRGVLVREDAIATTAALALRERYLERHPIARDLLAGGRHRLYALQITWAKLTDNRMGFGRHMVTEFGARWSALE